MFIEHLMCISSVQLVSPVLLFATPWTAARQASLSITNSQSLLKFMLSVYGIRIYQGGVGLKTEKARFLSFRLIWHLCERQLRTPTSCFHRLLFARPMSCVLLFFLYLVETEGRNPAHSWEMAELRCEPGQPGFRDRAFHFWAVPPLMEVGLPMALQACHWKIERKKVTLCVCVCVCIWFSGLSKQPTLSEWPKRKEQPEPWSLM